MKRGISPPYSIGSFLGPKFAVNVIQRLCMFVLRAEKYNLDETFFTA